jgi:hypothetical protein
MLDDPGYPATRFMDLIGFNKKKFLNNFYLIIW